jgi:hypothetical protein
MRTFRKIHPTKSQKAKAEADYADGKYENKNALGSRDYEEYHSTYHDLVLMEEFEEMQLGEMA